MTSTISPDRTDTVEDEFKKLAFDFAHIKNAYVLAGHQFHCIPIHVRADNVDEVTTRAFSPPKGPLGNQHLLTNLNEAHAQLRALNYQLERGKIEEAQYWAEEAGKLIDDMKDAVVGLEGMVGRFAAVARGVDWKDSTEMEQGLRLRREWLARVPTNAI